jgi:hypothetical protein
MDAALIRSYLSAQPQAKFMTLEVNPLFLFPPPLLPSASSVCGVLVVCQVRRAHVVQDTLTALARFKDDLQKPLKIVFAGEPGVDAGRRPFSSSRPLVASTSNVLSDRRRHQEGVLPTADAFAARSQLRCASCQTSEMIR